MPKMGLVLQGGGALGAYEYGAVTCLVERGWHPVAVTGVSIGAATAAAVAGARDDNISKSLKRLWEAITLDPVPFWPPERQAIFSIFGNPRFWRMRPDLFAYRDWTNLYDVSPMRETLAAVCDFDQLNDPTHMRLAVTATNVQTGDQVSFANFVANPEFCPLRHPKDFASNAHARSHLSKWQSSPCLSDDCNRRRSLLGWRLVRQYPNRIATRSFDGRRTRKSSHLHRQLVCDSF